MNSVRFWAFVGLVLVAGALPGQGQEKKAVIYPSDFYPLHKGNQWLYKVTVGDAPAKDAAAKDAPTVEITVEQEEPYEYKFMQGNKQDSERIVRFRLKVVSGMKKLTEHVAVWKDGVYRFASADKEITPPLRFLKLPVKKGETWTVESTSENVRLTGTFTCDDDKIKVPFGEFHALHISCPDFQLGAEKMALDYWFAQNVGIVKQRVRVGNSNVLLELEDFKAAK